LSFTRKEMNLVTDPYFEIIKETDQFIEVKSLNTNHCWNIFKNTFEAAMVVVLYHKHKPQDKYYHKHKIVRTVKEAVEEIKSHDAYVIEKMNKVIPEIETSDRQLKVYSGSGRDYKQVPQIRLQGKWLEDCGFETGTEFSVKCEAGKLTLTAM